MNFLKSFTHALLTTLCIVSLPLYAQTQQNEPVEITPQIEQSIKQKVDADAQKLKSKYKATHKYVSEEELTFVIDTFKIKSTARYYRNYDWSTPGLVTITDAAAAGYDKLLNVYYKKLLGKLQGDDKQSLIESQRAWLKFRDLEKKLIDTLGKDQYGGGGSQQSITYSNKSFDLLEKRTVELFEHYIEIP